MNALQADVWAHFFTQVPTADCPYCGVAQAHTIDHFLPQSKFPEFSFFSKNMVPACGQCNLGKRARWQSPRGHLRYPHPYFSTTSDVGLYCKIEWTGQSPPVIIYKVSRSRREYSALFDELRLEERFLLGAATKLTLILASQASARRRVGRNVDEIRKDLSEEARQEITAYGRFHWRALLFLAVSRMSNRALEMLTR
jgi:hypothetical protein